MPAYGAELMVFGRSDLSDEASSENIGNEVAEQPPMVYRGSVIVNESAGHLNRAIVVEGDEAFFVGDQVFLPSPVQLYITPVRNLTPNPYFTGRATNYIGSLLGTFTGIQVFSLPGSNRNTVDFLKQKCQNEGRYGLILQPFLVYQNGHSKVQLRMTSLYSGQSLGVLESEFTPFVSPAPQTFPGYR